MNAKEKIAAAVGIVRAVAETVREVRRAPAISVYLALMNHGATLQQFQSIVGILSRAGLVKENGDCLEWCGPVGTSQVN